MLTQKNNNTCYGAYQYTEHEKARYKSKIVILENAHSKVQTLYYFMLKSDLPNGDKHLIYLR